LEFWHHFISQIQQKEHAHHVDPTACFSFKQQVSQSQLTAGGSSASISKNHQRRRCEGRVERLSIAAPTDLKSAPGTVQDHHSWTAPAHSKPSLASLSATQAPLMGRRGLFRFVSHFSFLLSSFYSFLHIELTSVCFLSAAAVVV
jgi:hypothetical protein